MPKKSKIAPKNYYDMKGSVERDKKVKHKDVFGKQSTPSVKGTNKNTKKKIPKKKSNY